MAVSVNLQEVFSSDSQFNLSQKINFNFNQLLTLGLGEPGPVGPPGGQGPIGPAGPVGPTGDRGAKVFSIQSIENPIVNPNLAQGSEDGDIFINTRELYVKGVTVSGTWGEVVDFQSLINSQSLQDTYKVFQMGVGAGDAFSQHAKFLRTTGADISNTGLATTHPMYYVSGSSVKNSQLILSNFDELKTWRIQSGSLVQNASETDDVFDYTAISKIYAFLPSSLTGWRHQLELGSVDEIGITVGGNTEAYVLTPTEQNLKFRKYRVAATGLTGNLYNRADIDLSGPISSANSLNGEIIFSTNKKTDSATQTLEMGLTNAKILGERLTSQALNTDGLIISRAGTHHIAFGFSDTASQVINLKTSSNLTLLQINHASLNLANGNLQVTVTDPAKEVVIGNNAIRVKNTRLSAGLPFPTAMVPSSDPNTLDDYEEGTWTPNIEFSHALVYGLDNNDTGAWSVVNPVGRYIKIGQAIYLTFSFAIRFRLDESSLGLPDLIGDALSLGFTSTNAATVGTEFYGLVVGGLPFGKSLGIADFNVEASIVETTTPALRTKVLYATTNTTPVAIQPIAPGTLFGRHVCVGSVNPEPKIRLYGFRYSSQSGSDRLNSIVSRFTAHDLLKEFPASYTTITGSGWIFDGGGCDINEVGGGNDPGGNTIPA
jgi:hypothetical protein